jgi:HEPN domain-containing protein
LTGAVDDGIVVGRLDYLRMNREALQLISRQRRQEAAALLRANLFSGAYYLAGYSVECALKACIAKQTNRYDFPNKRLAGEAWTHDLQRLVQLAGVWPDLEREMEVSPALRLHWAIVRGWSESVRYDMTISRDQARNLYSACTRRRTGVLVWIRVRW